jgi:hypothetical protein
VTSFSAKLARIGAVLCVVAVLSSCRVDQSISLNVKPNGTGSVTVVVTADKAIVDKAPSLAQDIRTDDLKKAGWKVDGPTKTKTGGLTITLTHSFDTPTQATAILKQVSETRGPLHDLVLTRSGKDTNSKWALAGRLEVTGGLSSFIDDAGLELLDVAPYAAEVADAGLDLGDAVGITFTAALPGDVDATTGIQKDNAITWQIPMDGSRVDVATTTTHVAVGTSIARVGRTLILALLALWIAATIILLLLVANARNRRPRTPRL